MKRAVIGNIILVIAAVLLFLEICVCGLRIETINTSWMKFFYLPVFTAYLFVLLHTELENQKNCIYRNMTERKKRLKEKFMKEYLDFYHEVHEKGLNHGE